MIIPYGIVPCGIIWFDRLIFVVRNGQIGIGNTMKVTLSCDHRVVDGVTGSEFLTTFKSYLEEPALMLGASAI